MNGKAYAVEKGLPMEPSRYQLAGWLAIAQAVLFPLGFIIGIIDRLVGMARYGEVRIAFGLADLVMIAFTIIGVYVMLSFKKLLNERYNCTELNTLIVISILWSILFQVVGLVEGALAMMIGRHAEIALAIMFGGTIALSMIFIGIVDLLIAIRILRLKDKLNDLIVVLGYVTLIAGILEVTVLLSLLSLILVPVTCVLLGVILIREKEEVEFV
jgi:hypothetical protein